MWQLLDRFLLLLSLVWNASIRCFRCQAHGIASQAYKRHHLIGALRFNVSLSRQNPDLIGSEVDSLHLSFPYWPNGLPRIELAPRPYARIASNVLFLTASPPSYSAPP
jgi:hypothetical protein